MCIDRRLSVAERWTYSRFVVTCFEFGFRTAVTTVCFEDYSYVESSSFFLLLPKGSLNFLWLSFIPRLLSMRNIELRLESLLTAKMSSMEWPLLYISTIVLFLLVLDMDFVFLVGDLIFCYRCMTWAEALRSAAASSGSDPNISKTSATVVSGNILPLESILSWMEIYARLWCGKTRWMMPKSRDPRMALLNFDATTS